MRKLYSELDKALRERLDTLRNSVVEKYKAVFKEIENRKSELKIKEPHITADEEYKLDQINKVKSIAQLKNLEFEAIGFRAKKAK